MLDRLPRSLTAVLAIALAACASNRSAPRVAPAQVTVEEASPPEGLPYRLFLPADASAADPARLVIWLHPHGDSFVNEASSLAPELAAAHAALLVPITAVQAGWSEADARRLLDHTLPGVLRDARLRRGQPVLFGFSAGAQLALMFWKERPCAWSGLVLIAAVPAVPALPTTARWAPFDPPTQCVGRTRVLVIVGTDDPSSSQWSFVRDEWRRAGVPLQVRFVGGRGHDWLAGDALILNEIVEWLRSP